TNPVAAMTEVPNNVTVTATFNEAMDPATMTASIFSLRNASNQLVSATVSYNSSNQTISLVPGTTLVNGGVYTARIIGGSSGAKDISGNVLPEDFSWSFTVTVGDTTKPLITSVSPVNGTSNVSVTTEVTIAFNETMNA